MRDHRRFPRNREGASIILVAVSLVMIFAFAVLAIDVGTLYVTRTQLQNAADAAALAGAMGMIQSVGDSATAIDWAITLAGENEAFIGVEEGTGNARGSVVITEEDVTFPAAGRVRVSTHRTVASGDPLRTIFLDVIDPVSSGFTGVRASATAYYYYECGSDCPKPWSPPDRWYDANDDGAYDPDDGDYYDPETTGYVVPGDLGTQITFYLANGNDEGFGQFWYYAVNFPPVNKGDPIAGADQYREWIAGCADSSVVVEIGDTLQVEPGRMTGPTRQGIADLIALDPEAYYDEDAQQVVSGLPDVLVSPRIVKAALFNPDLGIVDLSGRNGVVVVKLIAFFIEELGGGGEVTGRFLQMADPGGVECDDPDDPTFLYAVKLVE
jgi:Flp pilus assembly protein TadG